MTTWNDARLAAPDLASRVQERFDEHGLALMATLRKDGSPRISPVEPLFAMDEVWLGMMEHSRKASDIARDPRIALHSATTDKNVAKGDAKVTGRALAVDDQETFDRFLAAFREANGYGPDGPFPLFRLDVTEISFLSPGGDHLVIEWWREGEAPQRIERR